MHYIDAQFVAVFVGWAGWENLCKFGGQTDRKEKDNRKERNRQT